MIGWIALFLVAYFLVALFLTDGGAKRALGIAAAHGELKSEAKAVLARNHRTRVRWVKEHMAQLPAEARAIAGRVVIFDLSCWVAMVALLVLYGLQFFAP